MRKIALILALAAAAQAQSLEEKYKKKLAKPFVTNAAWVTDFAAAKKQAAEKKQVIFAYFTRTFRP
ncbi:MAG: hypothetical protein ACYTGN_08490 [Planctomycetota bacterium]|jgi:ribosomal protein S17E